MTTKSKYRIAKSKLSRFMSRRVHNNEAWNRRTNKALDKTVCPYIDIEIMGLWALDPTDGDWVGDSVRLTTESRVSLLLRYKHNVVVDKEAAADA